MDDPEENLLYKEEVFQIENGLEVLVRGKFLDIEVQVYDTEPDLPEAVDNIF